MDLDGIAPVLGEVTLTVASDVGNPLLGETGAAATYGPQKGATPGQVKRLDANLARFADMLEEASGRSVRHIAGAGAAGGTTAGLLAVADRFAAFEVRPGVDVVMELTRFGEALVGCDLVLSGEGRIDRQTAYGKTALGVARSAAEAGKPCICFGGGVDEAGIDALSGLAVVVPTTERPASLEEQIAAGAAPVARAAERVARLLTAGGSLRS